ncbi:MAG: hypothetical protein GY833_22530 [Aestuariibacter sp.]|nr:hypothetical protein [Aestuariibacter sp.]|tara:strand:- start:247569 stop:248156 length:588 start_codon:yes stop_codon:yes gene_type:complete
MSDTQSNDYLSTPVSWPLLYRMVSVFEQHKARIIIDRPRELNASGREITNSRSYRRSGGRTTYKATMLPDDIYRAWNYFTCNAKKINQFLYRNGAVNAAKAVFVFMNVKLNSKDRAARARAKRESLFKGRYYGSFVTEIITKTLESKLGSRFDVLIEHTPDRYLFEVIGHASARAVMHDLKEPLALKTLAVQFIK